jgi:hypothetical protein
VLDGAGTTERAVGDEGRGLVVPLGVEVVDGVLQDARGGVVVLGGDEDEPVERGDPGGPGLGVVVGVDAPAGGHGLVQVRQRVVEQVDELVVGVRPFLGLGQHPPRHGFTLPARTGTAEDDRDLHRKSSHLNIQVRR